MPDTKKPRALPRVWKPFHALQKYECFFSTKSPASLMHKTSFITARSTQDGSLAFVAPWRRVRTTVLVRDAKPGGKGTSQMGPTGCAGVTTIPITGSSRPAYPTGAYQAGPTGPTHPTYPTGPTGAGVTRPVYPTGDGGSGGLCAPSHVVEIVASQPNSDNGVSGPTS